MVNKTGDSFSKILNGFDPSDSSTSTVLKGILNTYPFFQSASAYYLKTLKVQGKESFNELLPKTAILTHNRSCLLYTSPSPRDLSTSRMPSSA